jgi:uncharacterized protein YggE
MRYHLGALALLALVALAAPAGAQTSLPATRLVPHIDVAGEGSVDRMPDQGIVTFTIVTNDRYNALVVRLAPLGLAGAAIKTTSYSLTFNPQPAQPDPQVNTLYGFVASRDVTVTTMKTDQVGAIIDAGVAAGVTRVESSSFGLRDDRAAYRAALALAVASANAKAGVLAAAAHVRIVRVLQLGTGAYVPFQPVVAARFQVKQTADIYYVAPTLVQPNNLTVSASVSASYEVAPLP